MIRVVVAGTSAFGLPSFSVLASADDIHVVGCISQPARPVGRHGVLTPSPVAVWANEQQLPVLTPVNWRTETDLAALREWRPDVIVVAAYGVIVPADFLAIPTYGCINLHASLLPAYRGASPIAAAILHGDTTTGITYMRMDEGLDTGDILTQYSCSIQSTDTTVSLTQRVAQLAAEHIVQTLEDVVSGNSIGQPQAQSASYAKKITREDGRATWESAEQLDRRLRAYTPWPGLWTTWKGRTIKILAGEVVLDGPSEAPGTVVELEMGQWAIRCATGLFRPTEVQFSGKQPQAAEQIPGSYPDFLGSQLGS